NGQVKLCVPTALACGSCALVIVILDGLLYTINLGDCRAVLHRPKSPLQLSRDHSMKNTPEVDRIRVSEGGVIKNNRIGGGLSPTRGFGDFHYSKMGFICKPEIKVTIMAPDRSFVLMGTDGIWDHIDNEYAIQFVKFQLMIRGNKSIIDILYDLLKVICEDAKKGNNKMDNATIACIIFVEGTSLNEIAESFKLVNISLIFFQSKDKSLISFI
ncbi:MAG: protein serine/threonine phosphatase 2C family protein, partial [Sphingobacteriaceae bacterium]